MTIKLFPEVEKLYREDLLRYIRVRAERIARETPPDSDWDDTEEWLIDAAELAHATLRLLRLQ